jgi:fumarylacetoacetate (FAA) hydrolase
MKLATLNDGTRDGQLVVVARDLKTCHMAYPIAPTLQRALDDWAFIAPQLQDLYGLLNTNKARHSFAFDPAHCLAPLPRAYQWADGSTYRSHAERVYGARGMAIPDNFEKDLLLYQGGSDSLLGANQAVPFRQIEDGIDFEAEIVVFTGAIAMGAGPNECEQRICLVGLVNDWSLRELVPTETAKGFGFYQSKPASSFAPVVLTPDELGDTWQSAKLHLPVTISLNGQRFGRVEAGGMCASFAALLTHAARTRQLAAGSIFGGGTVSSPDATNGFACIAELRAEEQITTGMAKTPYLKFGDTVRIEVLDRSGASVFGAIEQIVQCLAR